ncbi:hypothetical protein L9F63_025900 [Diploptera punctata]|uniref:Uncharacterized protein n=1 Tax=Diploptera punctata TaxID=6984 RepID=A0AAD7Z6L5_DIPPU|nr:hypothetical protein L9F63_025900 [Diploptera punctata]
MEETTEPKTNLAPGHYLFLVNPWWKRKSIFTLPNASISPQSTAHREPTCLYPMPTTSGQPQIRIARLSPGINFIGPPPISNSQPFKGFTHFYKIESPGQEQVIESIDFQNEQVSQEQMDLQNKMVSNQEIFLPIPSPVNTESNTEEQSSSNQQTKQYNIVAEYQQKDPLDTTQMVLESRNFENMSATSAEEFITSDVHRIYQIQMNPNTGEIITENEISNVTQIIAENETTTFSNVEEAVATIDSANLANDSSVFSSDLSIPKLSVLSSLQEDMNKKLGLNMTVTDEKQEEVVKAAKSLFSKRTRTLYHWLYPDTSKNKLKATVSAAWDTLPEQEKHFYISQVLGRFGLQASSLMVNPQLGGMKGLPTELVSQNLRNSTSTDNIAESQRAVSDLFASCDDADSWASYSKPRSRNSKERRRKRKYRTNDESGLKARLGAIDPDELEEEAAILKRMREETLENEFEEDAELTSELEKFRLISQNASGCRDDDFWNKISDPEDIYSQLDL